MTVAAQARRPAPGAHRRQFLVRVSVALAAFAAALVAIPSGLFLFGLRRTPKVWRAVGAVDAFRVGETVAVSFLDSSPLPWSGVTSRTSAWLRRKGEQEFVAFAVNCTHLGCPVRWLPDAGLFMCPCHGGVFYEDGRVASGPPPRPLVRYPVRVQDGTVEILTSALPINPRRASEGG